MAAAQASTTTGYAFALTTTRAQGSTTESLLRAAEETTHARATLRISGGATSRATVRQRAPAPPARGLEIRMGASMGVS
jgi:hypothetical protein